MRLKVMDLFAGAGGLSEGLAAEGIEVRLAQELHPQPGLTHALNHPDTSVVVGDIRQLNLNVLRDVLQRNHGEDAVDIVVGGPPCQGFSSAGKKQIDDPRNNLFTHFCRVVAEFRPKAIVLENVPGFKTRYGGQIYQQARKAFSALGYELEDRILNARDYGVPQNRNRFVMVGIQRSLGLHWTWPEPTHGGHTEGLFGSLLKPFVTVEDAISDLEFVTPGFEGHRPLHTARTSYQLDRRSNSHLLFNHLATRHRSKAVEMFQHIPEGGTINAVPNALRSAKRTMARFDRKGVSNAVLALPDDLIHYDQDRIPSVRELARLQSYDDDYVFMGKRTSGFKERRVDVPQYTQVGNSVPPLLARAIGRALVRMFGAEGGDQRCLKARRERASWIRGSSARAGYTLANEATVRLYDLQGEILPLPLDERAVAVGDAEALVEWAVGERVGLSKQWAPNAMAI
ncbi:DNA cytosine methyltransferase [Novosphingobium sp. 1949]|uniref:Cytosine-specific methyltransferase n=1 Tax=Novosphingobium organovorum TaxID=2930092 RepID=A0ABT0BFX6_9SPHN|nr:DNA cytosine methyltransferase [Novosphingobium organovorum]MCJ2183926.1 DNA cytosine methyltransferase [Novosphingobium organovorum]